MCIDKQVCVCGISLQNSAESCEKKTTRFEIHKGFYVFMLFAFGAFSIFAELGPVPISGISILRGEIQYTVTKVLNLGIQ